MIIDLHNHTSLCNHAEGSVEEFVQRAILEKIDVFGFSDHAPMNFDEAYRMKFSEMDLYEQELLHVKEKYSEKIQILRAYEVDFLEGYIDQRVLDRKVDYFIGSVHYLGSWGFDNPEFIGQYQSKDIDQIWEEYFTAIKAMADSALFDIVGHLDLIKIFKYLPKKDIRLIARDAIDAIKKADMVIELNAAGFRKPISEQYPSHPLLEIIAEKEIPITFGSDAHSVDQIGLNNNLLHTIASTYGYKNCAIFESRDRKMVKF